MSIISSFEGFHVLLPGTGDDAFQLCFLITLGVAMCRWIAAKPAAAAAAAEGSEAEAAFLACRAPFPGGCICRL